MKRNLWLVFLVFAVLLVGCLPNNPAAQSADAPNIETIVAATYAAISAQTKAAEALFTSTPENTPTSTNSPLPPTVTPTYTPTFVIYTATPIFTNTPIYTNTPDRPADYECALLSTSPSNGTVVGPKHGFDWIIKVNNSGNEKWYAADVLWIYISGDKFFPAREYNLWKDVPAGKNIELGLDIEAPKQPGTYSMTWGLKRDTGDIFCRQTLKIIVK
jgi:hypothetical protein